jgi:hypothetical protein
LAQTEASNQTRGIRQSFGNFQIQNYYKFHVFAVLYSLIGIPTLITVFPQLPSLTHQILAVCAIFLPITITEFFWYRTSLLNPKDYVKTLKLKSYTFKIFWVLLIFFIFSLAALYVTLIMKIDSVLIPSLTFFAISIEAIAGFSIVESCLVGLDLPAIYNKKLRKTLLRSNARAYFTIVSREKALDKSIDEFKSGLNYMNGFLKVKFKFALLSIDEYFNYFRIQAFSTNEEEKDRIRDSLRAFAESLNEDLDLTNTLKAITSIRGKPFISIEEVAAQELDFNTGIKKTLLNNQQLITLIITLATFIISVIALLTLFH